MISDKISHFCEITCRFTRKNDCNDIISVDLRPIKSIFTFSDEIDISKNIINETANITRQNILKTSYLKAFVISFTYFLTTIG